MANVPNPDPEEIECRITWDDILSNNNPESFIFRSLQLQNINAYTVNGKFTTAKGILHCIDDVETRERVYIWCADTEKYPYCNCLICKSMPVVDYFHEDFLCNLIQELYNCGAAKAQDVTYQRIRVSTIRNRETEIRENQERENRRREQELRLAQQEQARAREEQRTRQEQETRRAERKVRQDKQKEQEVVQITIQKVVQVRQLRLED